jgi:hypothetical protein
MAEKLDLKEAVSFEEILMSNIFEQEAIINLLEKKGIIFREMSWEEIKGLRGKHPSPFKE